MCESHAIIRTDVITKIFPFRLGGVVRYPSWNSLEDAHRRQGRNYSNRTKSARAKQPAELCFGPLLTSGHDQHVEIQQARERDSLEAGIRLSITRSFPESPSASLRFFRMLTAGSSCQSCSTFFRI